MAFYDDQTLHNTLKELGILNEKDLEQALKDSQEQHIPFADLLIEKDLVSDENLGKTISELTKIPYVNLSQVVIPEDVLQVIPEVVAKKQHIIAFKKDERGLHIAMLDPTDLQLKNFIEKKAGIPVVVYLATKRDIESTFSLYTKDVTTVFDTIISESVRQAKGSAKPEPPIIRIVDTIMTYAYQNRASDIHIEPLKEHSLVRFRIDGILHDVIKLPLDLHTHIVTRIKVIARLRTDEHQASQDGKFQLKQENAEADIRVSIVPITHGEKIVMRLLSERSRQYSLADLGFAPHDLTKITAAYEKPYGMILSTGPTGSGKTTTMYGILKLLNQRDVNIATIEDPVEYEIDGVNQIQVNSKTNLTFANGLKSILRQDPNIILVGEIRDEETAAIAINAAMTGHLVLSTLHTNDATTAIPRLLDLGIEPYLAASTISVVIAQRLARKIHASCRVSKEIPFKELLRHVSEPLLLKAFHLPKRTKETVIIYEGKGCKLCHGTGYEGRVGIFEVLEITDNVRQAIIERKDASYIKAIAVKEGMGTMIEDGLDKVAQGQTTIEEIMRVTRE